MKMPLTVEISSFSTRRAEGATVPEIIAAMMGENEHETIHIQVDAKRQLLYHFINNNVLLSNFTPIMEDNNGF